MKKTVCVVALVCALLLTLTMGASAQTVQPLMPEGLRELVAGKTFIACMEGFASDLEKEHATLYFQICEQETYRAEEIEALAAGDTLIVGGEEFAIQAVAQDEFGYEITGEWYSIFLYKNDGGLYYAVTDTENRFYKNVFGIEVPASEELRFLDWGDPEADEPTVLTLRDLIARFESDDLHSTADNTEITFDENGKLIQLLYRYSPWN